MNLKGVMQVKNESDKKSDKKDDKSKKALFIQRLIAFLIDSAIVVFAASLLSTPFINSEKITDLNNKSIELMEKYKAGKESQKCRKHMQSRTRCFGGTGSQTQSR